MVKEARFMIAVAGVMFSACTPEILDTTSLVASPRLLAAQSSPAEGRAGTTLALRALDVGPDGPAGRALEWALCTARPPLTSPGALAPECLGQTPTALVPIDIAGDAVTATMPADVCQTFGPDQPAPKPGQPPGRPADPDPTGGYYQPLRILAPTDGGGGDASFEVRALCNLASATPEEQREFDRRYRANANPTIVGLAIDDGAPVPSIEADPASVTSVPPGASVRLRVAWPACPGPGEGSCGDGICGPDETSDACPTDCATPQGCGGAESYVYFDPRARAFVERRESIVVSWFATAGRFATGRTGRAEREAAQFVDSENVWTAPAAPADRWLWVVVRDTRGGVAWASYRLRVE